MTDEVEVLELNSTHVPVDPEDDVRITTQAEVKKESNKPVINQYIRGDLVGKGQHGEVYKCWDISQSHAVKAMKVVSRKNPRQEKLNKLRRRNIPPSGNHLPLTDNMGSTYQKILQEIAIMKRCRHPHIVRLLEVIDDKIYKKIYMIMEFLGGGEIKWRDKDGNPLLRVDQSRRIIRDVVLGLEYLHHQGIIHRDIKPANLMWTSDRRTVKITDFGVAHSSWAQRLAESGEENAPRDSTDHLFDDSELAKTAGTPSFLAPEVVWNGSSVSESTTPSSGAHLSPSSSQVAGTSSSPNGHGHGLLAQFSSGSVVHVSNGRSSASTVHLPPQTHTRTQSRRPPITKAIDVWALGVTLYCLLFGEIPFRADSEWALYQVIATEDWTVPETMGLDRIPTGGRHPTPGPNGKLSEGGVVVSFLERLLEKNASKRITLDEVKHHAWFLGDIPNPSQWVSETTQEKSKISTALDDDAITTALSPIRFRWVQGITQKFKNALRAVRPQRSANSFDARDPLDKVGTHSAPTVTMARYNKSTTTVSNQHHHETHHDHQSSRHKNGKKPSAAGPTRVSTPPPVPHHHSYHHGGSPSSRRSMHNMHSQSPIPQRLPAPIEVPSSRSKSMDRSRSPGSPSSPVGIHYPIGTTQKPRRGSSGLLPFPYANAQAQGSQQQVHQRSFSPTSSNGGDEHSDRRQPKNRWSMQSMKSMKNSVVSLCSRAISYGPGPHEASTSTVTSAANTATTGSTLPSASTSKNPSRQNSLGQTSSGMTSPYEGPTTRSSEEVSPSSPMSRFRPGHDHTYNHQFSGLSNPMRASSWGDVGDYGYGYARRYGGGHGHNAMEEVQSIHSGERLDEGIDEDVMLFGAGGVANGPLPPTPNGSILIAVPPVPHLSALSAACGPDGSGSPSASPATSPSPSTSTPSTLKAVPHELLHSVMGRDPATEADPATNEPGLYSRPVSSRPHAPSPLVQLSYSSEELGEGMDDDDDDSSFFDRDSEAGPPRSVGSRMYESDGSRSGDSDAEDDDEEEDIIPLEVRRRRPSWSITEADLPSDSDEEDEEGSGEHA